MSMIIMPNTDQRLQIIHQSPVTGAPRPDVPFPMAEMTELPAGGGPKTGGANLGPPPPTAQRRSVTGYDATEDAAAFEWSQAGVSSAEEEGKAAGKAIAINYSASIVQN
ncbi:Feline leukemia virus subgroup C receptor-related protein 1 [Folsomia candida]|uniref:Feline leukemia virus subgroup C receptor-related protein 1 n=1 Tax=Folsomia candida TaxID=158441 RepID=A0A226EMN1_FOLCA|nr:Feline leukemia virus subgroup C receptor-related protein 1 [Folsomia candida]